MSANDIVWPNDRNNYKGISTSSMYRSSDFLRWMVFSLIVVFAVLTGRPAQAYLPAVSLDRAPLVTPGDAWTYYQGVGASSGAIPNRRGYIRDLARALKNDPFLIYEHVRNTVEVTPMFGLKMGGVGVILSNHGTAFDQTHLLVEMLRESGYTANYKYGTLTLTGDEFGKWIGVVENLDEANQTFTVNAKATCQMLADGGIPATVNGATSCDTLSGTLSTVTLAHIWAEVTIDSVTYELDPSYKEHAFKAASVDLTTVTGFSESTLLGHANCSSADSCEGFDVGAFNSTLDGYANALLTHIKNTNVGLRLDDLLGGKDIIADSATSLAEITLTGTRSADTTWSQHIPNVFRTPLRIQFDTIDKTYYADDIAGDRIWIESTAVGTTTGRQVWLRTDKTRVGPSNTIHYVGLNGSALRNMLVTLTLNHPYAANSGSYADRSAQKRVEVERYAPIVFGLGTASTVLPGIWARAGKNINANYPGNTQFGGTTSYRPWDELHVISASWQAQLSQLLRLHGKIGNTAILQHDVLGFSYPRARKFETSGSSATFVNLALDIDTGISITSSNADASKRQRVFEAAASGASALEGAIITEVKNYVTPLSTARTFIRALAQGAAIKKITSANYASYANTLTNVGYTSFQKNWLQSYVNAGYDVFAPMKGEVTGASNNDYLSFGPFSANPVSSFIASKTDGTKLSHILVGITAVRKGAMGDLMPQTESLYELSLNYAAARAGLSGKSFGIDLVNGNFSFTPAPDLVLGSDDYPRGLSFQRYYDSQEQNSYLGGQGWTHNFDRTAAIGTNLLVALAQNRAIDGTTAIAGAFVSQNLTAAQALDTSLARLFADYRWTTRSVHNVVTVKQGLSTSQFVKLSDGTWRSPERSNDKITIVGSIPAFTQVNVGAVTDPSTGIVAISNQYDFTNYSIKVTTADNVVSDFATHPWDSHFPRNGAAIGAGYLTVLENREPTLLFTKQAFPDGNEITTQYELRPNNICGNIAFVGDIACTFDTNLYSVKNSMGHSLTLDNGWLTYNPGSFTGALNRTLNGVSDSAGRTVSFIGPESFSTVPEFSVTNPAGETTRYTSYSRLHILLGVLYDYNGQPYSYGGGDYFPSIEADRELESYAARLKQVFLPSDPQNAYLTFAYDRAGKLTSLTNALGDVTKIHVSGRRGEIVSPIGASTTVYHDEHGNTRRAIDALGESATAEYDVFDRLTKLTRPEGNSFEYEYDGGLVTDADVLHNVTKITANPKPGSQLADRISTFSYGDSNWPHKATEFVDPRGTILTGNYDATTGLVTQLTDAVGTSDETVTSYNYTTFGRLDTETLDPSGLDEVTQYTYYPVNASSSAAHTNGELQSTTIDPSGLALTSTQTYDNKGNMLSQTDPGGNVTNSTYDNVRRILQVSAPDPDGAGPLARPVTVNVYDIDGLLIEERRKQSSTEWQITQYGYDAVGRRTETVSPDNALTSYAYDAAGREIVMTDPENRKTKKVYDLKGQLVKEIRAWQGNADGSGGVDDCVVTNTLQQCYGRYIYSPNGQRLSLQDANDNITSFTFDGFDQLATSTFPDGTVETSLYDANGNNTQLTKRDGAVITFGYDSLDRMVQKQAQGLALVEHAYDKAGRKVADQQGGVIQYTYAFDKAGRNTSTVTPLGTLGYEYNAIGCRTNVVYPDGFEAATNCDALRRPTSVSAIDDSGTDLGTQVSFSYDLLSRRLAASYFNGVNSTYSYQADGMLSDLAHDFPIGPDYSGTFGHNLANQLTNRMITADYVWNAANDNATSYQVNTLNQYTQVADNTDTVAPQYDLNGNLTAYGDETFTYDSENRLIAYARTGADPITVDYDYDANGRRIKKTLNPGTGSELVTQYLLDGEQVIAEFDGSSIPLRRYLYASGGYVDEPLIYVDETLGATSSYAKNAQGSVVSMANAEGVNTEQYAYSAYGIDGIGNATSGQPYRYVGRRFDEETSLYYYRARYYHPNLGRFLQVDPIGFKDSNNLYTYAYNDPFNNNDPSGKCPWCFVSAAVSAGLEGGIQTIEIALGMRDGYDGRAILVAAGAGFLGVGVVSRVARFGKLAALGADLAGSIGTTLAKGENPTLVGVLLDVALGEAAGKTLGKKAAVWRENSDFVQQKRKEAARKERIAANGKGNRQRRKEKRQEDADTLNEAADIDVEEAAAVAGEIGGNVGEGVVGIVGCSTGTISCN